MKFEKQVSDEHYVPNQVPRKQRIVKLLLITFLLSYGSVGLYKGELYLQYGRGDVTLFGNAVILAFASFIVGSLYLALGILDHYDTRNNEHVYRRLEAIVKGVALLVLVVALGINVVYTAQA